VKIVSGIYATDIAPRKSSDPMPAARRERSSNGESNGGPHDKSNDGSNGGTARSIHCSAISNTHTAITAIALAELRAPY
jgi:hypothetical protein